MKKLSFKEICENPNIITGSSFAGIVIIASLEKMLDILGQPTIIGSGDNKVQLEWVYYNPNQMDEDECQCLTIYDWKMHIPIHEIKEWHIGSRHTSKEEIIEELLSYGFLKEQIKDY